MRSAPLSFPFGLAAGLVLVPFVGADELRPPGPPGVEAIRDVAYRDGPDADPLKHKLDLYLPAGRKNFPVLFFVHGGTWRSGDKKEYAPLGELFARQGLGTVIINYRLSPKVQHPAHIRDVAAAFAWTHANIGRYGGRADEVFLCGHSAGGHLVSLLSTDESYLKEEKLSFADVRATVSLSGVYLLLPPLFPRAFGTDPATYRDASPLEHVKGGHPPFLIVYADGDLPTIGPFSEKMARALVEAKGEASVVKVKDRDHVSIIKRMAGPDDPTTRAILDFIGRHSDPRPAAQEGK